MTWWRSLWQRRKEEHDLSRELEFHIAERITALKNAGLSDEEARRTVRQEFGGVEQVKDECRDVRRLHVLDDFGRDLRYSLRVLRKSPVFTAVAIISLALGIGANTAIFSLIDALLLRPLPVPQPDRLVSLSLDSPSGRPQTYLTYALFQEIAKQKSIFSGVFTWAGHQFQMRSGADMVHVDGALASGEYFPALGVPAQLGRTLAPEDDRPDGGKYGPVAVISDAFWASQFQRKPSVVGADLILDRVHFTIVGVMPRGFFGAEVGTKPSIWVPLWMSAKLDDPRCIGSRSCWWLVVMARRNEDLSPNQLQSALKVVSPQIMRAGIPTTWPTADQKQFSQRQIVAMPGENGWTTLRRQFSNPLAILMALVGIVLLIACANLANLSLARASARHREVAVRLAMGASRLRVIRQLLTESLLLSAVGAALGLIFARLSTRLLIAFLDSRGAGFGSPGFAQSAAFDLSPDWRIAAFTASATLASALLFGLMPALRATRVGLSVSLKEGAHHLQSERGPRIGIGRWLLALQVGLSMLLVAGAGLFAGSLFHLLTINPGFEPKNVTVIGIDTDKRPEKGAPLIALYSRLLARLNATPGIKAASLLWFTPLSESGWDDFLEVPGNSAIPKEERLADINLIAPRYFAAMGMPLLAGRDFGEGDSIASEKVAIVNQLTARRLFPHANPVGEHIVLEKGSLRIVGIVGNTKYMNLREPDPLVVYLPFPQATDGVPSLSFVIRTEGNSPIYPAFRAALHDIAPDIPIGSVKTMQRQLEDSLGRDRLLASLSLFFGLLALLLTAIGLYGVLSYTVSRRTGEIGVRMALGAARRDVVLLVLREAVSLVTIGVVAGLIAVLAISRLVASFLYGITPNDPGNIALAIVVLVAITVFAAYLPARRASHLDPMRALREE